MISGVLKFQADTFGAALDNSSDMSPKLDTKQSLIYKPTAKLVSKTTVSLLANMVCNIYTYILIFHHLLIYMTYSVRK